MGKKNNKTTAPKRAPKNTNTEPRTTRATSRNITVTGNIDVRPMGVGFVAAAGFAKDIRIPYNKHGVAIHGDEVKVRLTKIGNATSRAEGEIIEVLKRNTTQVIGIVDAGEDFAFVVPSNASITTDFFINIKHLNGAKHGDKVIISNIKWPSDPNKKPSAVIEEVISDAKAIDITMKEILLAEGFPLSFSSAAIADATASTLEIDAYERSVRRDFSDTFTFTIDPSDAKDFDDAISYKKLDNGLVEIGVHIADVSHFVQEGTALDKEAFTRATSVYLPDRVCPMLPETISNVLCSLRPNETKLTFSAVFIINEKAEVKDYWLGKTIIHSQRRYAYEDAEAVIEGGEDAYKDVILHCNTLAQIMRAQRLNTGAINFSSEEVRFNLDDTGFPIGIKLKVSKKANQLIEEFMLLANKTVAKHVSEVLIKKKQVPFAYRVHDVPDMDKLSVFLNVATSYGHKINTKDPVSLANSFNKLLLAVANKPEKMVLETLGIRSMAKAIYTSKNIGHYGLAFEHYCHFTSPIRRYPDILVHRVLQSIIEQNPTLDAAMEAKCKHCSDQERKAMHCERDANKYLQVVYMSKHIGEEFDGVISGVTENGFWVETKEHKCEGMVSLRNCLDIDVFKYIPQDVMLVGINTKIKIKMGDTITIRVAAANIDAKQLDYEWVLKNND